MPGDPRTPSLGYGARTLGASREEPPQRRRSLESGTGPTEHVGTQPLGTPRVPQGTREVRSLCEVRSLVRVWYAFRARLVRVLCIFCTRFCTFCTRFVHVWRAFCDRVVRLRLRSPVGMSSLFGWYAVCVRGVRTLGVCVVGV